MRICESLKIIITFFISCSFVRSKLINSNLIRGAQFFYNFVPIDKSFFLSIVEHFLFVNDLVAVSLLLFQSFCPPCCAKTIAHYNSLLICIILSTIPLTFPRLIRSITLKGSYQCKNSHHDIVPAILSIGRIIYENLEYGFKNTTSMR